jgi:hypothetical protein
MNRRDVVARALAGAAFVPAILASAAGVAQPVNRDPSRPKIAMLVYPDMILLDLVGPQTVFSLAMADVHLVWKTRGPVATDVGLAVAATTTFGDCPRDLDVLFVPGGLKGSVALMGDDEVLAFWTTAHETPNMSPAYAPARWYWALLACSKAIARPRTGTFANCSACWGPPSSPIVSWWIVAVSPAAGSRRVSILP